MPEEFDQLSDAGKMVFMLWIHHRTWHAFSAAIRQAFGANIETAEAGRKEAILLMNRYDREGVAAKAERRRRYVNAEKKGRR